MSAIASQITSLTIVYSTVYPGADQRKHQSSASLAFEGNSLMTDEFPAQRASNAETVSIWWRHHDQEWEMLTYYDVSFKNQAHEGLVMFEMFHIHSLPPLPRKTRFYSSFF